MRIAFLLAGLGLAVLSPDLSRAAGIDCTKATGPYGKAVCAEPGLRQRDQDMAAAYDKLAASASAAGQALVQRDEHDRRAYIEERCAPENKACLIATYDQALASLAGFNAQAAGAVLLPSERFELRADRTSLIIAAPRLDSPSLPWSKGFGQAATEAAEALEPDESDGVIDYRPIYLAADVVTVAFTVNGVQAAFTYLPTQQHGLRAADLFQSGTTWSGFLAERALAGLQDQAKADGWDLKAGSPGELEKSVADPTHWLIHADGLGLAFGAEAGAGDHEVLVPWDDLKPYLVATPPFAIAGR